MTSPAIVSASRRLLSVDVLRGVTIAFMIMVNNPGGEGAWTEMRHADWNGFTATDLVFPTFLFVWARPSSSPSGRGSTAAIREARLRGIRCGARCLVFVRHCRQRLSVFPSRPSSHLWRLAAHRHLLPDCEPVLPLGSPCLDQGYASCSACLLGAGFWCAGFQCRVQVCRVATFLFSTKTRTSLRGSTGS